MENTKKFIVEITSENDEISTVVTINGFSTLEAIGIASIVPQIIDGAIEDARQKAEALDEAIAEIEDDGE